MSDRSGPDGSMLPVHQAALVGEAALAPTVHNVQPARWRFGPDGWLMCYHAVDRALPEGDPTGRDVRLSIGAAIEGMAIACSRWHYQLEVHAHHQDGTREEWRSTLGPSPDGMQPVALLRTVPGRPDVDGLASVTATRRSWRGRFSGDASAQVAALRDEDLFIIGREHLDRVAVWQDDATWYFEQRPAYHAELWKWLRLSPEHPDWARDGLNADALVLSAVERRLAGILLRPRVFAALGRIGVARRLVSEQAPIRSATALLVFAPPESLDDWTVGRRFYRGWLTATRAGLALAPMSALADWSATREKIAELARVPANRRVVNVFRAGAAPAMTTAGRARLNANELLV